MRCGKDCDHSDDCAFSHNAKRCEEDALFREAVVEWKCLCGTTRDKERRVERDSDT